MAPSPATWRSRPARSAASRRPPRSPAASVTRRCPIAITSVSADAASSPATPGQFYFRNRGQALLRGLEAEAELSAKTGLSVSVGAQVASGEALDDDTPLDDSPAPGITLTVRQELRQRGYLLLRA